LNATQSGYLFIPMALGLLVAAPLGGLLVGKAKPSWVIALSTAGAGFGIWLFTFLDVRSTAWDIIIPLFIMAFFMGFGMAQRTSAITAAVPHSEIGIASGVLALARNIAGAFGIAVFATILQSTTYSNVLSIAKNSVLNIHTPEAIAQFTSLITLKAQIGAYTTIYEISAALLIFGAILAFFIKAPEKPDVDEPLILES
jgi:hypothetical protein